MSEREYSKGGYIPGPPLTVKVRKVGGRTEYWEPLMGRWVPVITAEEIRASGAYSAERIGGGK